MHPMIFFHLFENIFSSQIHLCIIWAISPFLFTFLLEQDKIYIHFFMDLFCLYQIFYPFDHCTYVAFFFPIYT